MLLWAQVQLSLYLDSDILRSSLGSLRLRVEKCLRADKLGCVGEETIKKGPFFQSKDLREKKKGEAVLGFQHRVLFYNVCCKLSLRMGFVRGS